MATLNRSELTETFDLLGHSHRRHVLRYLTRDSEAVGIETLAARIAASTDRPLYSGPRQTEQEALVALHHVHLPKLADGGLLTYRPETGTVTATGTDRATRLLDDLAAFGDSAAAPSGD